MLPQQPEHQEKYFPNNHILGQQLHIRSIACKIMRSIFMISVSELVIFIDHYFHCKFTVITKESIAAEPPHSPAQSSSTPLKHTPSQPASGPTTKQSHLDHYLKLGRHMVHYTY